MGGVSVHMLVEIVRVYFHSTLQKKSYSHEKKKTITTTREANLQRQAILLKLFQCFPQAKFAAH